MKRLYRPEGKLPRVRRPKATIALTSWLRLLQPRGKDNQTRRFRHALIGWRPSPLSTALVLALAGRRLRRRGPLPFHRQQCRGKWQLGEPARHRGGRDHE